ncbi:MAG: hypothetical protein AB7T49_10150 [Oligoflexales bacterium]
MLKTSLISSAVLLAMLTGSMACTKKKDKKSASKSTATAEEGEVVVAGQLAVTSTALVDAEKTILLFTLDARGVSDIPEEIAVAADGSFSLAVGNLNDSLEKLKQASPGDGTIDRDLVKEALPQYEEEIDAMDDDELIEQIDELVEETEKRGGSTYVMVSMDKSGDKVAEAQSFQFIGLPTGGANMLGLPSDAIKTNLNLGLISGDGDEAVAELEAGEDNFNMSGEAIKEFASLSGTLKVIKNYWMNADEDGNQPAEITPWFGWTTDDVAAVTNQFSTPTGLEYIGAGFYIGVNDIGAGFDDVCPTAAASNANASRSELTFLPPEEITSGDEEIVINSDSPFSNEGLLTRDSQYEGVSCMAGGNSMSGVYIRNDDAVEQPNNSEYQLGWGGINGEVPEGIWELKVDGDTAGSFDLASARPFDADGNPIVYVPSFKVTVDDNGKATKFEAKFLFYDKAAEEYREVEDTAAIDRMLSEVGIDLNFGDEDKSDVHVNTDSGEDRTGTFEDGLFTYEFIDSDKVYLDCSENADCLTSIGMSYVIGSVSYRMELRQSGN